MTFKNQIAIIASTATLFVFVASCGSKGSSISNLALVISSTLTPANSVGVASTTPCVASATSCTPTGLTGRVYAAGASLGGSRDEDGYNMTFMAGSDAVIDDPSQGFGGTIEFDVIKDEPYSGKASIPSADAMPANPIVSRIEFKADYFDTTFILTGTGANGTYTVRTVFVTTATASDVTGTMQRGDKLIKASGETAFKWCTASGCTADRPTSPYQQSAIASWVPSAQGGVYYTPIVFDIAEASQKTFDHATISDTTKIWEVDLGITNAITWGAAPSTFTNIQSIVQHFSLAYTPGTGSSEASSTLTATFDIVAPTL